jgi:hypothetical protein
VSKIRYATAIFHLRQLIKILVNHQGNRQALFRDEVFYLLKHVSPSVATKRNNIWYFVNTQDSGLGRIVFRKGSFEQEVMTYAVKLAAEHSTRQPVLKGQTFIDIGANIGTTTMEHDGAGGDHRVRMNTGISDGVYRESLRPIVEIQLRRFDDLVEELPIDLGKVGLVWMDTQGHEGHILSGAQTLLETNIPVIIEYWPYGLRRADGLELIHKLISGHYKRVIDIRASLEAQGVVDLPASDVRVLSERYGGESYTDLLLLT